MKCNNQLKIQKKKTCTDTIKLPAFKVKEIRMSPDFCSSEL